MKTQRRILLVVGAVLLVFAGLVTLAVILLGGVLGSLVVLAAVAAAVAAYLGLIRPWHVRWGATKDEVGRPMPGDGILGPGTGFTTRAVTIRAPTDQVWPWLNSARLRASRLVQLRLARQRRTAQRRADPARVAAPAPRRSDPHDARFRLRRRRRRKRPLLRRPRSGRHHVMVPGR